MSDDSWTPGFGEDSREFRKYIGPEAPPHSKKWDEAMQRAVEEKTKDWNTGQTGEFTVTFKVQVRKVNPGWIDGYKVELSP